MAAQTKPLPNAAADATSGARAWSQALDDPHFHDLPYKIETNARGQLVLTAKKFYRGGRSLPECAVATSEGVKGPGVVWIVEANGHVTFYDADGTLEASTLAPDFPMKVNG